jgi:hypothetical protein
VLNATELRRSNLQLVEKPLVKPLGVVRRSACGGVQRAPAKEESRIWELPRTTQVDSMSALRSMQLYRQIGDN